MPAAIPLAAQIAAQAAVSAVGLGAVAGSVVVAGAGLLASYVSLKALGGDSSSQTDALLNIKLNTSTTQRTIPLIYGEQKIGSNDVFIQADGSKPMYLYIVHCLGEGECEGIAQEDGKDLVYVNDKLVSDYKSDLIEYWFHAGTNTQTADSTLLSVFGGVYDDPLRNTAYVVFKIKYDTKVFSGIPNRTIVVKGIKIKDFRTDTVGWSQNPVLILYDYITNARYGLGWDESLIDAASPTSSWQVAANYCDMEETGDKVKYYVDFLVGSSLRAQSIIDSLLSHFRGTMSWFAGSIYLHYADLRYETTLFSITDDMIVRDNNGHDMVSVAQPSSFGVPDGVVVKFMNKKNKWTLDDIQIGDSNGNIKHVQYNAFTDRGLAFEFGTYLLERERLNRTFILILRPNAIEFDINDVGLLASSELGLTNQLVRVKESSITPDGLSQVTLILEDEELYNSVYNKDITDIYDVDLPAVGSQPPQVENITFEETVYVVRGRSYVRLKVSFDEPDSYPWFSYVEVYFRTDQEDEWSILFNSADDFTVDPVQEGVTYYFRLNSVSTFGNRQDDEDAAFVQHTIGGAIDVRPPAPLYLTATVTNDNIELYSPFLDAPEITAWEYRVGDSWNEAVFMTAQKYPYISYSGARPGSYTIWLDTWRDNGTDDGLYSLVPKYDDVVVEEPQAPYSSLYSTAVDFVNGVHSGTEYVDFGAPPYGLQCDRTTGLVGEYTTPEMDTAYVGTNQILIFVDYGVEIRYLDYTWDGIAADPLPWSDLPSTETWDSILVLSGKSSKVAISALYSASSGGPYVEVSRLEMLSASVAGRYFKLKFSIEDYNSTMRTVIQPSTFKAYERP